MSETLHDFYISIGVHGYAITGHVLETNAIVAEFPFHAVWDYTQAEREQALLMYIDSDGKRVMSHPPHWHYLPALVYAIIEQKLPAPEGYSGV